MYDLALGILPPVGEGVDALPFLFAQSPGERDVADRRVEPDVERFPFGVGIVERNGYAPGQVACHGAFGQTLRLHAA